MTRLVDVDTLTSDELLHLYGARRLREDRLREGLRQVVADLLEHFDPVEYHQAITDVVELRALWAGLPWPEAVKVLREVTENLGMAA